MTTRHGLLVLAAGCTACGLSLVGAGKDIGDGLGDGGSDRRVDATVDERDAPIDDATVVADGGPGDDAPRGDGAIDELDASNGCPSVRAGPIMAPVGSAPVGTAGFCIDTTEVTNAQYAAFLAGVPGSVPLPAVCGAKTAFAPTNGWPYAPGADNSPAVWLDWCDAYAYCQWAGKRLCGRIGGGSNPPGALTDPAQSQWYSACSADGARAYPYGAVYVQGACYGAQPAGAPLVAVASYPGCVGGYPGIFDMSGSVWEWEDSCSAETGGNDDCQIRGGSLAQTPAGLGCAVNTAVTRSGSTGDRGFRCCAP